MKKSIVFILFLTVKFTWAYPTLNPINFGADPSGKKSSTESINECIIYAQKNNIKQIVFTKGNYLITPSGKDDKYSLYGIRIDNCQNLSISTKGEVLLMNTSNNSEERFMSFFFITNSSQLTFSGFSFKNNYGTDSIKTRKLYTGAAFFIKDSHHLDIRGNKFDNNYYGVCSFSSSHLTICNNLFINESYDNEYNKPQSAFLLFSTSCSTVSDNTIYGSLMDGDLSLFGRRTDSCIVERNKLLGYRYGDLQKKITHLAQGITIDQGPTYNIVRNNSVYGYYYGIDVKADTYNNEALSNEIVYCKVGIAERRGEAVYVSYSSNNKIIGNNVRMGGNWDSKYLFWGKYETIGLAAENRANIYWVSNKITIENTSKPSSAIAVFDATEIKRTVADKLIIQKNSVLVENCLNKSSHAMFFKSVNTPLNVASNMLIMGKCNHLPSTKEIIELSGEVNEGVFTNNKINNVLVQLN